MVKRSWNGILTFCLLLLTMGIGVGVVLMPAAQQPVKAGHLTPSQVRTSVQKSIDWLTTATLNWDTANNCYGCHVQAQGARALAIAAKNQYNVDTNALTNRFMLRMRNQQNGGGNPACVNSPPGYIQHDPCGGGVWIWNPTTVAAAPAFSFYSNFVSTTYDSNLILMADYLARTDIQTPSGAWGTSPPLFPGDTWSWDSGTYGISESGTQTIQFTANAMMAIYRANQISPKAAYTTAIANGLAYLRTRVGSWGTDAQDGSHLIMGFIYGAGVSGTDPDIINIVNSLISVQNGDGGWGYISGQPSTAYSTGEVLNAMEAVGITMFSEPTGSNPGWITSFKNAVDWMVANQNADGSYASGGDAFINTMWAVVGTGSAFGPLTVSITNPAANGAEASTGIPITVSAVDNDGSFDVQRFALYLEDLSAFGPSDPPEVDTGFVAPGTFGGSFGNRTHTLNLPIPATPGKSYRVFARAWNTKVPPAYYDSTSRIIHNISSTLSTASAVGGPSTLAVAVKASGGAQTADAVVTLKTTGNGLAAGRTVKISTTFGTIVGSDTAVTNASGQATFQLSSAVPGSGVLTIRDITDSAVGVTVTLSTTPGVSFYSVGGFVYNDANKDGIKNGAETGVGGVTVKLSNGSSKVTLADGFYFFGDPIAAYTVTETDLSNYGSSTDNIVTTAAVATDLNFGDYTPTATISRSEWSRYHDYGTGNLENNGYNPDEATLTFNSNLNDRGLEWSLNLGSSIISGPVISTGYAYVVTTDNQLRAINLATKSQAWTYPLTAMANGIAPTVATINGVRTVVIGNNPGTLYGLNATSGALIWSLATGGTTISSSPAVVDGTVYGVVGTASGSIWAYDVATQKLKWKNTSLGAIDNRGNVAVRNGKVFVPLISPARIVALDQVSGNILWQYIAAGSEVGVSADATSVYFVSGGTLYSLNEATGGLNWSVALSDAASNTVPAISGGRLYVGGGNRVKAFTTGGALVWQSPVLPVSLNYQSAIFANNLVYISGGGLAYAFNQADGTQAWSYNFGGGSLAYANTVALGDRLYVPSSSGTFYSFHRAPRLAIAKAVFTDAALTIPATEIQPGQTLWYRLIVTNNGENQANNVSLKDRIPANSNYVAGTAAFVSGAGTVVPPGTPTGTVEWNGLNIPKGGSVTVKYQIQVL